MAPVSSRVGLGGLERVGVEKGGWTVGVGLYRDDLSHQVLSRAGSSYVPCVGTYAPPSTVRSRNCAANSLLCNHSLGNVFQRQDALVAATDVSDSSVAAIFVPIVVGACALCLTMEVPACEQLCRGQPSPTSCTIDCLSSGPCALFCVGGPVAIKWLLKLRRRTPPPPPPPPPPVKIINFTMPDALWCVPEGSVGFSEDGMLNGGGPQH